jgi:hypothetical protein
MTAALAALPPPHVVPTAAGSWARAAQAVCSASAPPSSHVAPAALLRALVRLLRVTRVGVPALAPLLLPDPALVLLVEERLREAGGEGGKDPCMERKRVQPAPADPTPSAILCCCLLLHQAQGGHRGKGLPSARCGEAHGPTLPLPTTPPRCLLRARRRPKAMEAPAARSRRAARKLSQQ